MADNTQMDLLIRLEADVLQAQTNLAKFEKQVGGIEKSVNKSVDAAAKEFKRMEAAINPAARAQQRYEKDVKTVEAAVRAGVVTQKRANATLTIAREKFAQASVGARGYAFQATRGMNSSRMMGVAIQQAGFQVGDFAVQVASGQSALRAFIQQGTQLISMFGPAGAVAGAFLAIGGAIATFLFMSDDAIEETGDAIATFSSVISESDKVVKAYTNNIRGLGDEYGTLTNKVNQFNEAQLIALTQRLKDEARDQAIALSEAFVEPTISGGPISAKTQAQFDKARTFLQQLKTPEAAQDFIVAFDNMILEMEEFASNSPILTKAVEDVRRNLMKLEAASVALAKVQQALRTGAIEDDIKGTDALAKQFEKVTSANAKRLRQIRRKAESDHEKDLTRVNKRIIKTQMMKQKELERLEKIHLKAVEKLRQEQANRLISTGVKSGIEQVLEDAENVARKTEQAVVKSFKGMEDALVSFVTTGKVDFKSLTNSIIQDMIRMQIQQNITKPLAQAALSFLPSLFGFTKGVSPTGSDVQGTPFSTGGDVSGPGTATSDSIMAFLSNGEFVVNAKAANRHRALLKALNSGKVNSFAAGGSVGSAAGMSGFGPQVIINDQRGAGDPDIQKSTARGANGQEVIELTILPAVDKAIRGGMFDKGLNQSFGVTRVGVQR